MKKQFKLIAGCMALVMSLTACSFNKETKEIGTPTPTAAVIDGGNNQGTDNDGGEVTPTATPTPTPTPRVKQPGHYELNPYTVPLMMTELMGQKMTDAYISFIDAVLKGETSFACADRDTYDWMMGQYAYVCCPVVDQYVCKSTNREPYENGRGYFEYTIPYEEFKDKYEEFATYITEILNEVLEDDYSDFEKAFALYMYFADNFSYDYDIYNLMYEQPVNDLVSGYLTLMEKKGVCGQLSVAYSYLLLQAGVDATVCSGCSDLSGEFHQWSYVRIEDVYYHIDPTFVLGSNMMSYFMMTDEGRYMEGHFPPESFVYVNNYYQWNPHEDYGCNDERFRPFWPACYEGIDCINHELKYYEYIGAEPERTDFVYDYRKLFTGEE